MSAERPLANLDEQHHSVEPNDQTEPGPLRGQVWLTLQTRQAQLLVRGRKGTSNQHAIIGLVGFADRLRLIWQAARDDDPYADWWLIKIHEGIAAAISLIQQQQQSLNDLLQQTAAFEIIPAVSEKPFRMPLQFANPYAYQGAKLLSDYDRLVCTALTAQHVGLLDRESYLEELNPCAHKIRSLFNLPQGYRSLGVNRQMIRDDKEASERACQQMGQVPDDVLNGECRAPLVPRKLRFPNAFANHVGLHPNTNPVKSIRKGLRKHRRLRIGFSLVCPITKVIIPACFKDLQGQEAMTKRQSGERVVLQLDQRVALEAILLNRLQRLPTNRRQEWLRGLLVQGFRQECQALRRYSDGDDQGPVMRFAPNFHNERNRVTAQSEEKAVVRKLPAHTIDKPFAALGKVIG